MDTDDATGVASRVLRRRPLSVLPPFVAEGGIGVIAQTVLLGTGAVALFAARGEGRIERVTDAITAAAESGSPSPADLAAIRDAVEGLLTPTVTAVLLVGALLTVGSLIVFRAAVGAAKVNAARAAVGLERHDRTGGEESADGPLVAAVRGVFSDTGSFVWLTALQAGILLGGGVLAALLGPAGVLLAIPLVLFAYVGFLFAPEAIVVDGVGAVEGVRRNLSFLRRETGRAGLYVVLEVGVYLGALIVSAALGQVGVSRASDVLTLFFVLPWLGLVRMGLYLPERAGTPAATGTTTQPTAPGGPAGADLPGDREATGDEFPERPTEGGPSGAERRRTGEDGDSPRPTAGVAGGGERETADRGASAVTVEGAEPGVGSVERGPGTAGTVSRLLGAFRAGVTELRRFVGGHPGLIAVALGAFALGAAIGRLLGPRATDPVTGDPGMVFGSFPLGTAVNIAVNNWLVAIAGSYAGVALGLPSIANLVFNGLIVGGLSGLFDPVVFAALVVPHALIEVPALAVGGALGLHLAREAYATAVGGATAEAFAAELRRGFLVLLGLLPVFAVAGVVEAFLTPLVGSLVGGV